MASIANSKYLWNVKWLQGVKSASAKSHINISMRFVMIQHRHRRILGCNIRVNLVWLHNRGDGHMSHTSIKLVDHLVWISNMVGNLKQGILRHYVGSNWSKLPPLQSLDLKIIMNHQIHTWICGQCLKGFHCINVHFDLFLYLYLNLKI